MKLFECQSCGQLLFFENRRCEKCSRQLGYLPGANTLSALEQDGPSWRPLASPTWLYRFCANAVYDACNWLVPIHSPEIYCRACRHNRVIPDLTGPGNILAWQKLEAAKHRLLYTLLKLNLPLENRIDRPDHGLTFDFLADPPGVSGPKVSTGHHNGVITIALAEADDAERESRRKAMGEPYRTLLGHLRHEVGHYFWERLVRDEGRLESFRVMFGDDREDYGQALQTHYGSGPPADWQDGSVSRYATTHAWEDWAETWAHYLHIVDTLEMAQAFGLQVRPTLGQSVGLEAVFNFDPYRAGTVAELIEAWLPLTFALNSLGGCLGLSDLYPFILSPTVITKLGFVHDLVHAQRPT